ncbi:FtsB family cell division protein [Arthrobacter sp. Sr24]
MATRRPSVPKAQFTSGLKGAPEVPPAVEPASKRTTTTPGSGARPTNTKADKRERQPTSKSQSRTSEDGVIHPAGTSPVPARSFSGRLIVLGITMGVVTILLAPNVHTFATQRTEIAQLREDITARQAQQDAYASELQRWDDPAYIKQQARDRVSMLMPGETGYWVYGGEDIESAQNSVAAAKAAAEATTAKKATEVTEDPWVDTLWESVKKSAQVQAPAAPVAPAETAPPAAPAVPAPVPAAPAAP